MTGLKRGIDEDSSCPRGGFPLYRPSHPTEMETEDRHSDRLDDLLRVVLKDVEEQFPEKAPSPFNDSQPPNGSEKRQGILKGFSGRGYRRHAVFCQEGFYPLEVRLL